MPDFLDEVGDIADLLRVIRWDVEFGPSSSRDGAVFEDEVEENSRNNDDGYAG
jgi:hypothetical protein